MTNAKKPEVHRQHIIDVARHLFAVNGYAQTTTRMINEHLNDAAGLLYYYFPQGKRQILNAVVARGSEWPAPEIDWQLAAGASSSVLASKIIAGFEQLWTQLLQAEHLETITVLVRERVLLEVTQTKWLLALYDHVQQSLLAALTAAGVKLERATMLAGLLMALFQKQIFDHVLVDNAMVTATEFGQGMRTDVLALLDS